MHAAQADLPPITDVEQIREYHESFIKYYADEGAVNDLFAALPSFIGPDAASREPVVWVDGLLRRWPFASLDDLTPQDGRYPDAHDHPVAGALLDFMVDVARFGITEHPLFAPRWTVKQLLQHAGNVALETTTKPHRDHGDSNAVTYNTKVKGLPQHMAVRSSDYRVQRIELKNNRIIVLNGQYEFIPSLGYHGTAAHWTGTTVDRSKRQVLGAEERMRFLAYVDGEDTGYIGDYPEEDRLRIESEIVRSWPLGLLSVRR